MTTSTETTTVLLLGGRAAYANGMVAAVGAAPPTGRRASTSSTIHGDPAHAQSWGQIPKGFRDSFPAFYHPGEACNPIHTVLVE